MNYLKLKYNKCFFCTKNYNLVDLTDMNNNAVLINDESVEFRDLVLDVCSVALAPDKSNYSCAECNNNLVLFHMFKRDVKKYSNFHEYINKLSILQKAELFLDNCENRSNLIIEEDPTKFILSTEARVDDIQQEIQMIEYDPDEEQIIESTSQYDDSMDVPMIEEVPKKFSTNDDLTSEQLQWIHEEVKQSEVAKGKNIVFKCSVCHTTLSTAASLVRHLRDLHLLSMTQNGLKAEIQRSKINVLSPEGPGAYWQCHFCKEEKIYRSEQGFKMHLKSVHADEGFSTDFVPSTWICSIETCKEIFQSVEEVQNHTRSVHSTDNKIFREEPKNDEPAPKRRKLNTLHNLSDTQLEWIKNQATSAEVIRGRKRFFQCSLCQVELSTQASLVRHLRDVHVLKNSDDEKPALKDESSASKIEIDNEIIWKCMNCDKIYKSEQAFKLHYRMTHVNQTEVTSSLIANCKASIIDKNQVREVWKCPECERTFKQRDGLRKHIKSEHPNIDEIKEKVKEKSQSLRNEKFSSRGEKFCFECGLEFQINRHHVKPRVHRECHEAFKVLAPHMHRFKCESCRMIFSTEESLQVHLNVHDDPEKIEPILISEKGLSAYGAVSFKDPAGDADDVLEEALDDVWKCGHCPSKYLDENDCVAHQILLHSPKIFCFVDNREFDGSSGLSKYVTHMKNKHPEYFPNLTYPCGSCGQEFPSIYEKLAHQKLCNAKKFSCDYCDKKYSNKHQLQAHMLFELGISGFSCEQCGKRCKTMSDLRIHFNSHTNERPYPCSLCEKSFKTPAARSTHMEKHTLDSGIVCEICNMKLSNRSLYKRHMRFQHNSKFREEQYEKNVCKICNKSYLRTNQFKSHMKQHESGQS